MQFKKFLLAAAAAITLTSGAAIAAPAHNQGNLIQIADSRWDRDDRRDNGRWDRDDRRDHSRWDRDDRRDRDGNRWDRRDHRRYVSHDRVYRELRSRHYRHASAPYFYRGHYVVRAYDRRGRTVLVRVNPYTGSFLSASFRF